ncbi:MAG: DUF7670 domain-containing protein [Bacteroidales bacterium]
MKTINKNLKILRWVARIISVPLILFIGVQLIFPEHGFQDNLKLSTKESIMVIFYPLMYFIGLVISWKWDAIGGIISIFGVLIAAFFRPDILFLFLVLSIPAALFIAYWYLSKKELETAN